jgi:hypothetical protein
MYTIGKETVMSNLLSTRKIIHSVRPAYVVALILFVHLQSFSASLKDTADSYFTGLGNAFGTIAAGKAVRSPKTSVASVYFVGALKKHPTFFSLLRVNAKGYLINEVIRGKTPQKVMRTIATQQWFKQVAGTKEECRDMIEDNGRFYLFWVTPITSTTKAKKEVLSFAVAVKIDLWDCFEALSKTTATPFQVRVGAKTLFAHDWNDTIKHTEESLTIPGTEKVFIRIPGPPAPEVQADTAKPVDSTLIKAQQDSITKAKAPIDHEKIKGVVQKYYIGIAVGIILIALILGIWFYTWFSQWLVKRRIDKEENYKFK